jgi:hypothetical protein
MTREIHAMTDDATMDEFEAMMAERLDKQIPIRGSAEPILMSAREITAHNACLDSVVAIIEQIAARVADNPNCSLQRRADVPGTLMAIAAECAELMITPERGSSDD